MKNKTVAFAALGGALLYTLTSALPAAAIECNGRDQWNSGQNAWISSRYCEDNLIATVARSRGMLVTGYQVRNNPSIMERACRFVGDDIRIQDICAGHLPEDYGRRRY